METIHTKELTEGILIQQYEEQSRKKYIGDALLNFLLRDIMFIPGRSRKDLRGIEADIRCNINLNQISEKLELKPKRHPINKPAAIDLEPANALLAWLYDIYQKNGLLVAREKVIELLIHEHKEPILYIPSRRKKWIKLEDWICEGISNMKEKLKTTSAENQYEKTALTATLKAFESIKALIDENEEIEQTPIT